MNTLCVPLNSKLTMADSDVNWRRRETDPSEQPTSLFLQQCALPKDHVPEKTDDCCDTYATFKKTLDGMRECFQCLNPLDGDVCGPRGPLNVKTASIFIYVPLVPWSLFATLKVIHTPWSSFEGESSGFLRCGKASWKTCCANILLKSFSLAKTSKRWKPSGLGARQQYKTRWGQSAETEEESTSKRPGSTVEKSGFWCFTWRGRMENFVGRTFGKVLGENECTYIRHC